MLLSHFKQYQERIAALKARTRDTLLTVPTSGEANEYFKSRATINPGLVWDGTNMRANAVAAVKDGITEPTYREKALSEIGAAKDEAAVAKVMESYGFGPSSQWTTGPNGIGSAIGTANTDATALGHLGAAARTGMSRVAAMNAANKRFHGR